MPDSFSRSTRLSASVFSCIFLNSGMTVFETMKAMTAITGMMTIIDIESFRFMIKAMTEPPTSRIGALMAVRRTLMSIS
ncbi:MAG: hypothetical protein BWY37_02225 [Firmicutes bacterium ADurb.Bin262]|nr:MAG: hypothetical protein BWY37_02225 [Firmicutes bacterium ADurb.Bin262]